MDRTSFFLRVAACGLAAGVLSACQFFAPGANEATLAAQNQQLTTEIAALRVSATVQADQLLVTLEFVQTAVRTTDGQTAQLVATLNAAGTPLDAITTNNITPQFDPIPTEAAGFTPVANSAGGSPPPLDLGMGVTPISITPGVGGAQSAQNASAPVDPSAALNLSALATPDTSNAPLTNIVTAAAVRSDDCAQQAVTTFDNGANDQIYVVATAQGVAAGDTIRSRWLANGAEIVSYDWSPDFNIDGACIWFFIDQGEITFTPGTWTVELSVNGTVIQPPATFSITGESAALAGDAMLEEALNNSQTP